jgi:hypothetical protein
MKCIIAQSNITDRAVEEIILLCHNLKHLDLYGALHISNLSIFKSQKCALILYILILDTLNLFLIKSLKLSQSIYMSDLKYLGLKNYYGINQKTIDMLFPAHYLLDDKNLAKFLCGKNILIITTLDQLEDILHNCKT